MMKKQFVIILLMTASVARVYGYDIDLKPISAVDVQSAVQNLPVAVPMDMPTYHFENKSAAIQPEAPLFQPQAAVGTGEGMYVSSAQQVHTNASVAPAASGGYTVVYASVRAAEVAGAAHLRVLPLRKSRLGRKVTRVTSAVGDNGMAKRRLGGIGGITPPPTTGGDDGEGGNIVDPGGGTGPSDWQLPLSDSLLPLFFLAIIYGIFCFRRRYCFLLTFDL